MKARDLSGKMTKSQAKRLLTLSNVRKVIGRLMQTNDSPQKIARGFAIGIFWGILPTFGFAIIFSLPTAVLLKANKFSSILGTFVSNPFTFPFIQYFGYKIGGLILGYAPLAFSWEIINIEKLLNISKSLLVGSTIFALSVSLLSYVLVLKIVIRYRRRAHSRTDVTGTPRQGR